MFYKPLYILFVFIMILFLNSCGKTINPYESEFTCPPHEPGKCVSLPQAYVESLENSNVKEGNKTDNTSLLRDPLLLSPAEKAYVESLYNVLTKLLKDPQTPIVVPPKIVRVLVLPYQDESGKNFYSARYVYVLVDDVKWVLHNILTMPPVDE